MICIYIYIYIYNVHIYKHESDVPSQLSTLLQHTHFSESSFTCDNWYYLIFQKRKITQKVIWIINGNQLLEEHVQNRPETSQNEQSRNSKSKILSFLFSDHLINTFQFLKTCRNKPKIGPEKNSKWFYKTKTACHIIFACDSD